MGWGAILVVLGAAIALVGPNLGAGPGDTASWASQWFSAVYVDEFNHTGIANAQMPLGVVSTILAILLAGLGIGAWRHGNRQHGQTLGLAACASALGLVALAWLTYHAVYALVPCQQLGFGLCDTNGGLLPGTWVKLNGVVWQAVGAGIAAWGGAWLAAGHTVYTGDERFLRAAVTWNGQVVAEKLLRKPGLLTIGEHPANALQVAASGLQRHVLAAPLGTDVYRLEVPTGVTGTLTLNGQPLPVSQPCSKVLSRGDSAVLQFDNDVSLLLAFVAPQSGALTPAFHNREAALVGSFATVFSAAVVLFVLLASAPMTEPQADDREAIAVKQRAFIEVSLMPPPEEVPPPEELPAPPADGKTPAKRASGEQGKAGDPREDVKKLAKFAKSAEPPREKINVREIGVAKALASPAAMQGAIATILAGDTGQFASKMAVAVAGDSAENLPGHGTNGMRFRGTGGGGGGPEGPGFIRGSQDLPGMGTDLGRKAPLALGKKVAKGPGKITIADGPVSGGCSKDDIRKNVMARAHAFRACYETQLLSQPDLGGKVTVQWTIAADGRVQGEKVTADSLGSTPVTDCLLRAVRRIQFAAPEAGVCAVAWPFVLRSN